MGKIWYCEVEMPEGVNIPSGGDFPPRQYVKEAMYKMTGEYPIRVSSGWSPLASRSNGPSS